MSWTTRYASDRDLRDFLAIPMDEDRVLIRRGYEGRIRELGWWGGESRVVDRAAGGREAHPVVQLETGERLLVRRFRRGGVMRHVNRETYFVGNRALEELRVTVAAARRGVSVPYLIAAIERPRSVGYTAELAVRWIDEAVELVVWLTKADASHRLAALRETGKQIGRLHEAGVGHPDLNLRNLLVAPGLSPDERKVFILDFDRATVSPRPVSRIWRWRDLMRLGRSASKLGQPLQRDDWDALRLGYGLGWPLT